MNLSLTNFLYYFSTIQIWKCKFPEFLPLFFNYRNLETFLSYKLLKFFLLFLNHRNLKIFSSCKFSNFLLRYFSKFCSAKLLNYFYYLSTKKFRNLVKKFLFLSFSLFPFFPFFRRTKEDDRNEDSLNSR